MLSGCQILQYWASSHHSVYLQAGTQQIHAVLVHTKQGIYPVQRNIAVQARSVDAGPVLIRRRGAAQTALAVATIQHFDYSVCPGLPPAVSTWWCPIC